MSHIKKGSLMISKENKKVQDKAAALAEERAGAVKTTLADRKVVQTARVAADKVEAAAKKAKKSSKKSAKKSPAKKKSVKKTVKKKAAKRPAKKSAGKRTVKRASKR
jgi:hypothetical protein